MSFILSPRAQNFFHFDIYSDGHSTTYLSARNALLSFARTMRRRKCSTS